MKKTKKSNIMKKEEKQQILNELGSEGVKILPWIGDNYEDGLKISSDGKIDYNNYNHKKLLILNPSFYGDTKENTKIMAYGVINEDVEGCLPSFRRFENAILGKEHTKEDIENFWNHVAFYTYRQENNSAIVLKSDSLKDNAYKEYFDKVVDKLSPDYIICWGTILMETIRSSHKKVKDPFVYYIEDSSYEIEEIVIGKRPVLFLGLYHPSSMHFSIQENREALITAFKYR